MLGHAHSRLHKRLEIILVRLLTYFALQITGALINCQFHSGWKKMQQQKEFRRPGAAGGPLIKCDLSDLFVILQIRKDRNVDLIWARPTFLTVKSRNRNVLQGGVCLTVQIVECLYEEASLGPIKIKSSTSDLLSKQCSTIYISASQHWWSCFYKYAMGRQIFMAVKNRLLCFIILSSSLRRTSGFNTSCVSRFDV